MQQVSVWVGSEDWGWSPDSMTRFPHLCKSIPVRIVIEIKQVSPCVYICVHYCW